MTTYKTKRAPKQIKIIKSNDEETPNMCIIRGCRLPDIYLIILSAHDSFQNHINFCTEHYNELGRVMEEYGA
jgi:hypothetical protein